MGSWRRLFGRDRDLAALEAAAVDAADGKGSTTVVRGPAGIGKTALLTEFTARRRAAGDLVLVGRASPDPGAPGYWPWTQILGDAWRSVDDPQIDLERGSSLDPLRGVVPGLSSNTGEPLDAPSTTGSAYAVYEAAMVLLSLAARTRPTVIVFDDVHHADAGSWSLLELVVRGTVGSRLLTVVSSRPDDDLPPERHAQLDRFVGYGRRIDLGGLTRADVEEFLAASAGGEADPAVVDTVQRLSGGNPLFVAELSVVLAGGGSIVDLERQSPSLMVAIQRVVAAAGTSNRQLLQAAAILGIAFDESTLAHVAGGDARTARQTGRALVELATRGLLESDGDGNWRFGHELLREAVLAALSDAERIELHRRCAAAIADQGLGVHGRIGAVAGHLVAIARLGGPSSPAVEQCRRAGDDARTRFAHSEAEHWWSEAIDLARRDPEVDDTDRLELLLELGAAQIRAGGAERARSTFERARTLAGHLDDPVAAARAVIGYADARVRGPGRETELQDLRGDLEPAVAALGDAEREHPLVLTRALEHLAGCLALSSEPEAARAVADRAVEVAASCGSPDAGQAALAAMRFAVLDSPNLAERSDITEQLMLLALQSNDPEAEWTAARWRFLDGLEAGDSNRVLPALATTVRLADRLLDGELQIHALIHTATVALLEGRFADMAEIHAQAMALADDVDVSVEPILGQDLFASRERGDLDLGGLRLILEARPLPVYRALVCWGSANLGRPDDTRADLDRFFDGPDLPELPTDVYLLSILAMLSEAVCFVGDVERAGALRRRLEPYRDHCVIAGVGPYVWTGSVHHYLGLLALTVGDLAAAAEHADRALRVHQRMGASPWTLRTQMLLAHIAENEARTEDARRQLEQVAATASALSMAAIQVAATEALDRLGGARAEAGERWMLRRSGPEWTLTTPRGERHLPARKGLAYLHELLSRPTVDVHVVDLSGSSGSPIDAGGAGPVLDDRAKEAYRRRVEDLRDQIAEGEAWGDDERVVRAQSELDAIADELSAAMGLGGRDRRAADGAERARVNVTRAIRSAIALVGDHDADVARHLEATIQTGTYCSYHPDPGSGITWST